MKTNPTMKRINILKAAVIALASATMFAGCVQEAFEEITEINLARCLEPQNLSAKVSVVTGEDVTFGWDVNRDADSYNLVVYSDEAMTVKVLDETILPSDVPYTVKLTADEKYYFKVQALSETKQASNWAVYDGHASTYAVKDNLFMEVSARTENSISLKWSTEVSDFKEVTHIVASPVKGGSKVNYDLVDADKNSGTATLTGLAASTEYQIVLYYLSASRGAVDAWTMAAPGTKTVITTSEELKTAVAGGEFFLSYSAAGYEMGAAKPTASLTLVGELGPNGEKPVITGNIELTSALASGSTLHFENVCFSDTGVTGHVVTFTDDAAPATIEKIEFVNCDMTGFKSGIFYNNKAGGLTVGEVLYDSCDIYGILGSGGDGFDIRKPTTITTVKFVNNTIWDGFRTFVRLDANDAIKIGGFVFENNTIKGICVMNDGNNQGFFAPKIGTALTLKNNIFLWEDGGETTEGVDDKTQLVRDNSAIVLPDITAENNYAYAQGKDFFKAVSAAAAGFTVLDADPCYNSKGNFFQLSNPDLIAKKVGAAKWWISYVEKEEDLTQNVLEGAHTWNLQDATLFAGDVKNSRVRDELLLVGTEAVPMNADNGINFLSASELTKKGVPTAGYLAFKVNTAGSVDLQVANGGSASVVIALFDDNGFAIKGGVMATPTAGVQKVVIPAVTGEGTVYLYSTGAISLTKLAWSLDTTAGNKVLPTPKLTVEPVTLTEGDATEVTVTWDAIQNAASYAVVFNKKSYPAQTELSFTVDAETIASLKAGLYNFTVQAFPREDDIYYVKSEQGVASVAVQPKSAGEAQTEVTLSWNFSDADWVEAFQTNFTAINNNQDVTFALNGLTVVGGGGTLKYNFVGENVYYIQMGGAGSATKRALTFDAPEAGTVKVWASNTGDSDALDRMVNVALNGTDLDSQAGGYKKSDGPHELEFAVSGPGTVAIYGTGGLCFYKVEFTYTTGAPAAVEYDWNFSDADWVDAFQTNFTAINNNQDVTFALNGLTVVGGGGTLKYNFVGENVYYIQMGGAGSATKRALTFDAPEAGTVKVWASNTGDSDALDRMVNVALNGTDLDSQAGGYKKSDGPHELEFAVSGPGTVAIYGTGGLCFYHVYYTNK